MKEAVCPKCNHQFVLETPPRSKTGRCSQCNHELPDPWRWKRCEGCNEHERMRIAMYRAKKKLKLTKQTTEQKQDTPSVPAIKSRIDWPDIDYGQIMPVED